MPTTSAVTSLVPTRKASARIYLSEGSRGRVPRNRCCREEPPSGRGWRQKGGEKLMTEKYSSPAPAPKSSSWLSGRRYFSYLCVTAVTHPPPSVQIRIPRVCKHQAKILASFSSERGTREESFLSFRSLVAIIGERGN